METQREVTGQKEYCEEAAYVVKSAIIGGEESAPTFPENPFFGR